MISNKLPVNEGTPSFSNDFAEHLVNIKFYARSWGYTVNKKDTVSALRWHKFACEDANNE